METTIEVDEFFKMPESRHPRPYISLLRLASRRSKQLFRGFPKIRGTILGVPITRIIIYWGLYWGPLFRETTI